MGQNLLHIIQTIYITRTAYPASLQNADFIGLHDLPDPPIRQFLRHQRLPGFEPPSSATQH
jgi:hypothetical protein